MGSLLAYTDSNNNCQHNYPLSLTFSGPHHLNHFHVVHPWNHQDLHQSSGSYVISRCAKVPPGIADEDEILTALEDVKDGGRANRSALAHPARGELLVRRRTEACR